MKNRRGKFYVNPILLVVIAALIVAAALIAASEFSARQKQQVVLGPGPEPSHEEAQSTEEPSQTEESQETPVITAQPTKGDPDAPVTIVEFAEFYCPFCAKYLWETFPKIEEEYIEKDLVKYEFRNLVVHGAISLLTSVAGECAQEQGKFWEFHDRLFETVFPGRNIYQQEQLEIDDLKRVAVQVGLDMESFNRCIEDYNSAYNRLLADYNQCTEGGEDKEQCAAEFNEHLSSNRMMEKILDDQQELRRLIDQLPPDEQAQAQRIGTPTFFINGHIFIGAQPYENFKQVIERELERAQGG
jgi:protein-disulfide isomerase